MLKNKFQNKICPICNRPFSWRKKWKKDWDNVKYCSKKCRRNNKNITIVRTIKNVFNKFK